MHALPRVSVIVPVLDEEANVGPLVRAVREALGERGAWELLFVDDGSVDRTAAEVGKQAAHDPRVRLLRLARNFGQTAAMQAGFDHARGEVIVSMDGDLQNDPADIPRLLARLAEGYDLVAGYRLDRQDAWWSRKAPSVAANRLIRWITGLPIRDNGCSLKAYRRELVERISLYADQHRFIPALAAATAGARITEVGVRHHARRFGRSKYGLSRVLKVLADLLTLLLIGSFRERPLALFAAAAAAAAGLGIAFGVGAIVAITTFSPSKSSAYVLPAVSGLWLTASCYLLMLGLLAESALRTASGEAPDAPPIAQRG